MFIRPCVGRITSRFQKDRLDPVSKKFKRDHVGTDFAQSGNIPIHAVAGGKVTLARSATPDGFGRVVFIEHLNSRGAVTHTTVYAHLKQVIAKLGATVKQGQLIGYMGTTGNSTGQHLHLELHIGKRFSDNRNAVDAMMYLPLEVALKLNDKGPNVKMMQELLVKRGYLAKVDGSFGPLTEKAVKAYQNKNKLTVDGFAGPATMAKLKTSNVPAPKKEVEKMAQLLNDTGREEAKQLITKAVESGLFKKLHLSKLDSYSDADLISYSIAYVNRTAK